MSARLNAPTPGSSSYGRLLVGLDVDNGLGPLAGRDLALEQNVNLTVRAALHLRNEEVGHDETEETSAAPNVTALAAEVCLLPGVSIVSCKN